MAFKRDALTAVVLRRRGNELSGDPQANYAYRNRRALRMRNWWPTRIRTWNQRIMSQEFLAYVSNT